MAKRKPGVLKKGSSWFARYTLDCGREHRGVAHSEWEAHIISANMSGRHCLGHAGRGRRVKRTKPVSLTFKSVAEEWLSYYPTLERVRESTMRNYRGFTERHLIPALGPLPITSVDVDRVEQFIASKRQGEGKLMDSSLRTGLLALRLILKRAKRRGLIPASPMPDVEWQGAKPTEHVDPFTAQELRAIFAAADSVDWTFGTMLRVWAGSGARAGEVTGLQSQDVDGHKGTVLIRRTFSHHRVLPSTKTGRERVVSFLHPVHIEGGGWRPVDDGLLARLSKVRALEPEAFLFGGARPWSAPIVHRLWRRTLLKAQVRYRVAEQLRHTLASTLLSRNAPLTYVQRQGGWRSASTLLNVYSRWVEQAEAGAMDSAGGLERAVTV